MAFDPIATNQRNHSDLREEKNFDIENQIGATYAFTPDSNYIIDP